MQRLRNNNRDLHGLTGRICKFHMEIWRKQEILLPFWSASITQRRHSTSTHSFRGDPRARSSKTKGYGRDSFHQLKILLVHCSGRCCIVFDIDWIKSFSIRSNIVIQLFATSRNKLLWLNCLIVIIKNSVYLQYLVCYFHALVIQVA